MHERFRRLSTHPRRMSESRDLFLFCKPTARAVGHMFGIFASESGERVRYRQQREAECDSLFTLRCANRCQLQKCREAGISRWERSCFHVRYYVNKPN